MPFLIPVIAVAASVAASAAAAAGATAVALALALVAVAASITAAVLAPGFENRARLQTVQLKQAVTPHRLLFGERRLSGAITFLTVKNGDQLHIVITLCAHTSAGWRTVYLNNEPIYKNMLDGDGIVLYGRYQSVVKIQVSLGDEDVDTQPFPDLVSENIGWTNAHKQFGHTKIYVRLDADEGGIFVNTGMPNISVALQGVKLTDNRTAANHWTPNPVVCLQHYLRRDVLRSGLGVPLADLDLTSLDAAANVCDEFVDTQPIDHVCDQDDNFSVGPDFGLFQEPDLIPAPAIDATTNEISFTGDSSTRTFLEFMTGDRVQILNVSDTLPPELAVSTNYYVIVAREMRHKVRVFTPQGVGLQQEDRLIPPRIRLATSYVNAIKGTEINLSASGTGVFTVRKFAEPRYTLNYLVEVDQEPHTILSEMASAMNPIEGGVTIVGGKYFFNAAAWAAPTLTFDEDDMVGPLTIATNVSRKERVNVVTGLYVSPLNFEQPTNFPEVSNATYITEDNEQTLPIQRNLPATSRPAMAQRLAKIILEDARQAISFHTKFNLKGLKAVPGDNVSITNSRMGWSSKAFRVKEWGIATEDFNGKPALVVDMFLKETAEGIYDWNSGEETVVDLASNSDLPDPFVIDPPAAIQVVESRTSPTGVRTVQVTTVSWTASPHGMVGSYDVEYKLTADSTWIATPRTNALTLDIIDQTPGFYEFRVRARTTIGMLSAWVGHTQEIFGNIDTPGDPTGLSVIITEGLATLSWTQTVDDDVRLGGTVEIRHDSDTSTPDWANSVGIGSGDIPGGATQATVPLRDGHLLVKFVDVAGNKSLNPATVKVLQDSAHNWSTIDTATEETAFLGAKNNLVVTASKLTLDLSGGDVISAGDYTYNENSIDLGSVLNVRVTPTVTVVTSFINDTVDDRSGNVDDWINWDGVEGSECDVRNEMRTTLDDPGGFPVWTTWELLDANVVTARGLEYRTQVTSTDDEANIEISNLSVKVEERLVL